MKREVLTVSVEITGEARVNGRHREAGIVTFTGTVDCENFKGRILPGGADTQTMENGHLTLSARYILEGTDSDGEPCRVFIENNGSTDEPDKPMITTPVIVTDSPRLRWLEDAKLTGTLESAGEMAVLIHIFAE